MLAKKTSKNQLTLPKDIADRFPGVDLFDATVEENRIVLVPVKLTPINTSLESIREKMEKHRKCFRSYTPTSNNG